MNLSTHHWELGLAFDSPVRWMLRWIQHCDSHRIWLQMTLTDIMMPRRSDKDETKPRIHWFACKLREITLQHNTWIFCTDHQLGCLHPVLIQQQSPGGENRFEMCHSNGKQISAVGWKWSWQNKVSAKTNGSFTLISFCECVTGQYIFYGGFWEPNEVPSPSEVTHSWICERLFKY